MSQGMNATILKFNIGRIDANYLEHNQPLFSKPVSSCFTVLYLLIFVIGILGNVSTCLVIIKRHYMHSSTNFYLCNLAISDLTILLVGLPTDVYYFWRPYKAIGGTWFCIFKGFLTETASNVSILTIVTFTFERWVNICHPFKNSNNFGAQQNLKKIIYNIGLIWTLSSIAAAPISIQLGIIEYSSEYSQCNVVADREIPYSFEISSILFFVFPMTFITAFYLLIIVELRRTLNKAFSVLDSPLLQTTTSTRQQAKASGAVVKILVAVVFAFFICFLPFHMQRLLATYLKEKMIGETNAQLAEFSQILFMISGVLYYFSTTANPLIYNILSKRFRMAFKEFLFCRKRVVKSQQGNENGCLLTPVRRNGGTNNYPTNSKRSPFLVASSPRRCFCSFSSENNVKVILEEQSPRGKNFQVIDYENVRPKTLLLDQKTSEHIINIWSDRCLQKPNVVKFNHAVSV